MKKGFTLVELSIVLIIIGLLVGGILVGQNLIDSAKVNRLVTDLRQYEIAINNFKSKFKFYPGDSPQFTPPGRGNNDIGMGGPSGIAMCSASNPTLANLEYVNVWSHLSQASMLSTNYISYSPAGCQGGPHSDDYGAASNAFKLAPMVELDDKALAHPYAGNQKKFPIGASKQLPADNFALFFYTRPLTTLALENKLSGASYVNPKQTGFVNYDGLGNCQNVAANPVLCTNSNAVLGYVGYYLSPI